jgi:hypothetical protein
VSYLGSYDGYNYGRYGLILGCGVEEVLVVGKEGYLGFYREKKGNIMV